MDISKLTITELRDLQQQIPQEMKQRQVRDMNELLAEMRSLAKARGYTLEELLAMEGKLPKLRSATGNAKVKYRHPENSGLEWAGRGRKPKWVQSWLENGGTMESLMV